MIANPKQIMNVIRKMKSFNHGLTRSSFPDIINLSIKYYQTMLLRFNSS